MKKILHFFQKFFSSNVALVNQLDEKCEIDCNGNLAANTIFTLETHNLPKFENLFLVIFQGEWHAKEQWNIIKVTPVRPAPFLLIDNEAEETRKSSEKTQTSKLSR